MAEDTLAAAFPTGTITLLFTDIEGSTQMLQHLGDRYGAVLEQHHQLMQAAITAHRGLVVDTQGDGFFVVFARAGDAVAATVEAQRALHEYSWPEGGEAKVRMALHTGEPLLSANGANYTGMDVHHAARLMAAGHGGQVLLSQTTAALTSAHLPVGATLRDLGEHRLKDIVQAERISQLVAPGLPADFPPLRTLSNHPHNLPAQLTPLIGRKREVAAICELLKRDELRLLILTGPGGIGKTRLSLQVAQELLVDYEDGVFFVPLATIHAADLLVSALASTLGLQEVAGQTPLQTVIEYLHDKRVLLVLDNFEQIVEAASLVAEVLAACHHLKILVSSRIVLRISGEYEFPVPPLSLPGRRPPPPLEEMTQYAAVSLFIERAQSVKPAFTITKDNAPAIAEICHRLDGLPLAIELAAARIKLLPPAALLARLENRLKFLTGGGRDLTPRQQTLRGAIAWSHDLLHETEQALFRRLAVFVGGCTLEAAEAVCNADDETQADAIYLDVFEGIASLMDNSLLWQQEAEGEPRFTMLETIREFALEKLGESGEETMLRRQHARYYLAFAEVAYPLLLGSAELPKWIERLEYRNDNLRAALDWLFANDPSTGLRLAMMVARFWRTIGRDTELRVMLERALESTHKDDDAVPVEVRIVVLRELGEVWHRLTDFMKGTEFLEESVALSRASGDLKNLGWSLRRLVDAVNFQYEPEKAQALVEEILAIERERNDDAGTAAALQYAGSLAREQGDLTQARACYEECGALWYKSGNLSNHASSLIKLAALDYMQGDKASARSHWEKALPVLRYLKDNGALLWGLRWLCELTVDYGDYESGRVVNEEYLWLSRKLEDKAGVRRALWLLAKIDMEEHRFAEAHELLRQVVPMVRDLDGRTHLLNLLVDFARIATAAAQWERAARLCGVIEALSRRDDAVLWERRVAVHDATLAATRAALGETTFAAMFAAGQAMSLEQATTYVLESTQAVAV